ncbi:MAG: hypothetical protein J6Y78_18035 [Paludibacteraceae bacterium]|nr:hypothetical protein [Paludibacteraceae bacterium]
MIDESVVLPELAKLFNESDSSDKFMDELSRVMKQDKAGFCAYMKVITKQSLSNS